MNMSRCVVIGSVVASLALALACGDVSFVSADAAVVDDAATAVAEASSDVSPVLDASADAPSEPDAPPGCQQGKGPTLVRIAPLGGAAPFCVDATEVTKAQYKEFLDAVTADAAAITQPAQCAWNKSFVPPFDWPPTGREQHPVNNVDWCDARAYCTWAGKRLCGSPAGGPATGGTSAGSAWYLACRGPVDTKYPYGPDYDASTCNGCESQSICGQVVYNKTDPVASHPRCIGGYAGLFDMSGNVEEWEDLCDSDAGASANCAARGGGWNADESDLRCQTSTLRPRDRILGEVGFRCCSN